MTVVQEATTNIQQITDIVDQVTTKKPSLLQRIFGAIIQVVAGIIQAFVGAAPGSVGLKVVTAAASQSLTAGYNLWLGLRDQNHNTQNTQEDCLTQVFNGPDNTSLANGISVMISESFQSIQGVELAAEPLSSGPEAVQDDYTAFLEFAGTGQFSGDKLPPIMDKTDEERLLTSLLVTISLDINGYVALLRPGVNPAAIHANGASSCPSWATSECGKGKGEVEGQCHGQVDASGQCGYYWFSPSQNSSYTLVQADGRKTDQKKVTSILQQLFQSGLTTGADLFETPTACALHAQFPPSSNATYDANAGGFYFLTGTYPLLQQYAQSVNDTTSFYPIAGTSLAQANAWEQLVPTLIPPSLDTPVGADGLGGGGNCFSSLNITIPNT